MFPRLLLVIQCPKYHNVHIMLSLGEVLQAAAGSWLSVP